MPQATTVVNQSQREATPVRVGARNYQAAARARVLVERREQVVEDRTVKGADGQTSATRLARRRRRQREEREQRVGGDARARGRVQLLAVCVSTETANHRKRRRMGAGRMGAAAMGSSSSWEAALYLRARAVVVWCW